MKRRKQTDLGASGADSQQADKTMAPRCARLQLCLLIALAPLAGAQCPPNTMTSFERISGVMVKDPLMTVLYSAANLTSHLSSPGPPIIPITAECNNRCRRSVKCRAFLVNYETHTCYAVEHHSSTSASLSMLQRSPAPIQLAPTNERTSYFEKLCLKLPTFECDRAWYFERVIGYQIQGHDDRIVEDITSRLKCQELCLKEREFSCRSGEYDSLQMQCRLSGSDRHSKQNLFRPTSSNVDYFENQCISGDAQCDAYDRYEDTDLGRAEIMRQANSSDQCQQICTQSIKAFVCRSFTWNPMAGKCYLNSANSLMVGGMDRLISAPGLVYYQRNECVDLRLECDTDAMTLNLRTNEPFRGRMYVRDDPSGCETLGRSGLTSSLQIPFHQTLGARCATREMPNRYSSVVVVQQHPLIQRKTDRYIKVVCDFQTSNKTITSAYNVNANVWTSTALINATSSAPKIRLRITDKFGVDITGAKLGDELYLRIEAESDSVYDMMARSVLARSGTTNESIMLVDKDGCPADFRIFPSLRKLNRRTIVGKFDAFKFSSDVVVRFQVDVQFCLNQCPSIDCDQSLLLNSQAPDLGNSPEPYSMGSLTTASPSSPMMTQLGGEGASTPMPELTYGLAPTSSSPAPSPELSSSSASSTPQPRYNFSSAQQQPPSQLVLSSPYQDRQHLGGFFVPDQHHTMRQPANQPNLDPIANSLNRVDLELQQAAESGPQMSFESRQISKSEQHKSARSVGRQRRSVEPIPDAPGSVPLQREIIVETSALPGSDSQKRKSEKGSRAASQRNNRQLERQPTSSGKFVEIVSWNGQCRERQICSLFALHLRARANVNRSICCRAILISCALRIEQGQASEQVRERV